MDRVTLGKNNPNFTEEEVWIWFGERGVYSNSTEQFKSCFDVFEHKQGVFRYRLKLKKEWEITQPLETKGLFSEIVLHDPMETLYLREYGDDINAIFTHMRGEELEMIENQ